MNYPAAANNGFALNFAKIAGTPFTLDAILTALLNPMEMEKSCLHPKLPP
jgi:hypothetical protein